MQQKYEAILADTSCFILLDKIGELALLSKIFGTITTTQQIALEFGKNLPAWVNIHADPDPGFIAINMYGVDPGEASLLGLALQIPGSLLILDDYKARKLAQRSGLKFTGTLGILLKAKQMGIITSVRIILEKVQQTNFRFSEQVLQDILKEAGE